MSDRYQKIATSPVGKSLFNTLGLPTPVTLDRQDAADADFIKGKVLVGAATGSSLLGAIAKLWLIPVLRYAVRPMQQRLLMYPKRQNLPEKK